MTGIMTGQLLSNRYLVGERIGVGGMAEVYQGQDTVLGRIVAIKVMLPQYAEDPSFTARFRQEAAAAANLQSPYIVNVYDWGQDPKSSFIVMEYVRGSDLKTAIKERGSINQRKVAEIGSQVAQALSVAHGLDIIHRDIKPQNIMVQPDGNVKVMDFGIARAKNSMMDKTDAVLGTAHYISPEQAQGKDLSPASDIYSLGVVLYEAVTGQLPFDGPDAVSVAMKQVNETPARPSELLPSINPDLEAIIMKAMSKKPEDRFVTALEMRQALNNFLAGRSVNLGGFTEAETAVIAEAGTQVISPVKPAYAVDKTGVMNPSDVNNINRNGTRQRSYRNNDDGKKNGSKKRGALIAVGAIAAVAIIALLGFLFLGKGCSGAGSEVPDVTGKSLEEATQIIEDAGFKVGTVDYIYDEKVPADSVISQTPRGGTHQEAGTRITLTVSQGIEQVSVPDLSNMTANEARAALQKLGLKYEAGAAEHSDTVAENRVLRQDPEAGKKVNKGATVTYYLSAGKEQIDVPNVVGSLEGAATATLTNAGFKVAVDYQSSATVSEGTVISQSPGPEEKAEKGATVSIVVSTGAQYFSASAYVTNGGGSVNPSNTSVAEGGSVTFYITANSGYRIASVSDSNGVSYGTNSTVTISNVQGNVSLAVTFEQVAQNNTPAPSQGSDSSKKQG